MDKTASKEHGQWKELECPMPLELCLADILVTWSLNPAMGIPWVGEPTVLLQLCGSWREAGPAGLADKP